MRNRTYFHPRLTRRPQLRRQSKLWQFLNSSLGLWLLSALFVYGLGSLFRDFASKQQDVRIRLEKSLDEDRAKRERAQRLDREIAYRFSQILTVLDEQDNTWEANLTWYRTVVENAPSQAEAVLQTFPKVDSYQLKTDDLCKSLRLSPQNATVHVETLYPEYLAYSLPSLITELASLSESAAQRRQLEIVRTNLIAMRPRSIVDPFPMLGPSPEYLLAKDIQTNCVLPRWRRLGFPFMTCVDVDGPLC